MINKKMTLGEAIKVKPEIIQVFSDENIDFCCGGNRTIEEVVEEKNCDVDSFVRLLNNLTNNEESKIEDALTLNKKDLINYIIRTHHVTELKLFDAIDKNMQKLIDVHYVNHGKELGDIYSVFLNIKKDILPHFYKEERVDFPKFLETDKVDFSELESEHEHVGGLLKELEEKTNNYTAPEDACLTYKHTFNELKDLQDDIHKHIFLENSVLFLK